MRRGAAVSMHTRPWESRGNRRFRFPRYLSGRRPGSVTHDPCGRVGPIGSPTPTSAPRGTWNTPSLRVLEKLDFEGDHLSMEENGEVVWLTRSLP
ncbi:hypothetical protein SGA01_06970 [Streptomyces gardneri]|uniref:Uncharacterized protein n=1 Tax=Streptomyces gardneri TaxID=66892 RepID=A0A4Y3RBP6_9ACTN|nr:hypothetical protein SGA01_06970 [Streptomyces gardneri]